MVLGLFARVASQFMPSYINNVGSISALIGGIITSLTFNHLGRIGGTCMGHL